MFEEVKKNFGFGCMRLPQKDDKIDYEEMCKMVDYFLENGFNYFDTAHGYHNGASEIAVRECLTKRYPRDKYILTDKLTGTYFEKQEDIRPLFQSQLEACGVDYFDFYLMHSQNKTFYEKFKACKAYETAIELKKEGKIKHFGISFHDSADVLEQILKDYPEIEVVQIQFNYVDYDNPAIQSKKCYDVCRKYNKSIIVMEPVRGGNLANLPDDVAQILKDLNGGSEASYAIRYCASFEGIFMTLSGMSNMDQMKDNISFMKDFKPLNDKEMEALKQVVEKLDAKKLIRCTSCRYCVDGCPKKIRIPDLFTDMNTKALYKTFNSDWYYMIHTLNRGKASDCIKCGKCETICPQKLPIRNLLVEVAKEFEKKDEE